MKRGQPAPVELTHREREMVWLALFWTQLMVDTKQAEPRFFGFKRYDTLSAALQALEEKFSRRGSRSGQEEPPLEAA